MVKFIFQFSNFGLSSFELLPEWAGVMMSFGWQSNQVFKPIIIPNTIYMMNLPTFGGRSISIFPDHNMFKNLMACISAGVVSQREQYIPIAVFNSAPLPMRIFFTLLILVNYIMRQKPGSRRKGN